MVPLYHKIFILSIASSDFFLRSAFPFTKAYQDVASLSSRLSAPLCRNPRRSPKGTASLFLRGILFAVMENLLQGSGFSFSPRRTAQDQKSSPGTMSFFRLFPFQRRKAFCSFLLRSDFEPLSRGEMHLSSRAGTASCAHDAPHGRPTTQNAFSNLPGIGAGRAPSPTRIP